MNLSQVQVDLEIESTVDITPQYRAEEARLLKIIEALQKVSATREWSTLKTEVFDNLVNVYEKDLRTEAERPDCTPEKLNRIAGKLEWARRYSDLGKLQNDYRVQLQAVRTKLHGTTEETGR